MRLAGARRDTVDAVAGGVVVQLTIVASGVLAARLLGPADRGLLALVWIVALVLAQVGTLGLPAALTFFLARRRVDREGLRRLLRIAVAQAAVLVLVQTGALLLLFGARGTPALVAALVSLGVLPGMLAQYYGLAVLQGLGRFRALQVLRVLPTAMYALALAAGFVAGADSLLFVVLAWTGGYAVAGAVTLLVALPLRTARVEDPVAGHELRSYGGRTLLSVMSPLEIFRVDQLLVGLLLSVHDLGLYVAALAFTNLPRFIAQGIGQSAVARIAPLSDPNIIRHAIGRYTLSGTLLAAAIAAPLAVFAEPLVTLFFGASFAGAAPLLVALQVGTVLVCARRVLGEGLRAAGHPGAASVAEAWSYAVLAAALPLGAVAGGAVGIAWAVTASALVSLLVLVALARRRGLLGPAPAFGLPAVSRS